MDQEPVDAQAYVDDIVFLARGRDLGALHNSITACLAFVDQWADANGLIFSPSKSEEEMALASSSPLWCATTEVHQGKIPCV